jgi:hypothetical protein
MSIFYIINLRKKRKKNHGHRGPGFLGRGREAMMKI